MNIIYKDAVMVWKAFPIYKHHKVKTIPRGLVWSA